MLNFIKIFTMKPRTPFFGSKIKMEVAFADINTLSAFVSLGSKW